MDATTFQQHLAAALGLCRAAADVGLPIEEMLGHLQDARDALYENRGDPQSHIELDALEQIIRAVGDVADIGSRLPAPQCTKVPAGPGSFPMPANLKEA